MATLLKLLTNKKQALMLKKKSYYRQFVLSFFFCFGVDFFSFLEIIIKLLTDRCYVALPAMFRTSLTMKENHKNLKKLLRKCL